MFNPNAPEFSFLYDDEDQHISIIVYVSMDKLKTQFNTDYLFYNRKVCGNRWFIELFFACTTMSKNFSSKVILNLVKT